MITESDISILPNQAYASSISDPLFLRLKYLLIFSCTGSLLLCGLPPVAVFIRCTGFSWPSSSPGSRGSGPMWSSVGTAWAQGLWRRELAAPWHVESAQTRDQTCVPELADWFLASYLSHPKFPYCHMYLNHLPRRLRFCKQLSTCWNSKRYTFKNLYFKNSSQFIKQDLKISHTFRRDKHCIL